MSSELRSRLRSVSFTLGAAAFGSLVGCASPLMRPETPPPPAPGSVQTTGAVLGSASAPGDVAAPERASPVVNDVPQRWTDEEVFAAAVAAEEGARDATKLARKRSRDVRVDRFAVHVLDDTRELQMAEDPLARSIRPQESLLRGRVRDAKTELYEVIRLAAATEFDHDFVAAEARYAKALLQILDEEMIPSAKNPDLRSYLQTLRARMASRVSAVEEIEARLP